jgi:hypothetical protein
MNRFLTTTERVFLAMAERVVMNPVLMVRCRGTLSLAQVEHAVRTVQRRHPALQVRVVREQRPWYCDRDVGAPSVRVVERESDETWREVVREELNHPLDIEHGPLIRFVLVRDEHACELICTTDHVNADGRSGLFVLRDVLRVIEQPDLRLVPLRERTCFDDYLPTSAFDLRLPDSLRGLWAERTRASIVSLERLLDRGAERLVARGAGAALDVQEPPMRRAPIEFVHRRLDRERTAALEQACRAHDNTVFTALVVACARALLTVERPDAKGVIGCITPIDIRPLLSPSVGDDFGIYAWAPTSFHPLGPDSDFWAMGRRMLRIVRGYRSIPALAGMRRLLDAMEFTEGTALASSYDRFMRVALDGMMVVSNLGRIEMPERAANVEIESVGFFAMIPNIEFVLGVQSFRGVLEMNYCCSPDWMRAAVIERVADRVEAALARVSDGPQARNS